MAGRTKSETPEAGVKIVATNRRARFDYDLGERYEAGLVLVGSEVKSLRNGSANIAEAWACVERGEAFVEGMRIPVLKHAAFGHVEDRTRKLLLNRREIDAIRREIEQKGMTVVLTRLYFRSGRAKVELAIAKGRRKGDRREAIKGREAEREARAAVVRARRGR
jgi:SsrA-binding protein